MKEKRRGAAIPGGMVMRICNLRKFSYISNKTVLCLLTIGGRIVKIETDDVV